MAGLAAMTALAVTGSIVGVLMGALDLAITSFAEGQFLEPKISVPRGRGIVGWVAERGESLLIPDAYADDRFYQDADKQTGFRTRSILCAPLKREGKVIGVLQILNPRDKTTFEEQDLDGFTAYANLTATAIDKLRSLERMRAQERVERDIAIASDIQKELLSRAIPTEIPGAAFAAHKDIGWNDGGGAGKHGDGGQHGGRVGEACSYQGGLVCHSQGEKGMANLVERGAHSQRLVPPLA